MAKAVETPQTTITTAPEPVTTKKLSDLYDAVHKFEIETGNEKAFLEKFGSRKQWLNQSKPHKNGGI